MNDNRRQDGIYPFPAGMQPREIEANGAKIHVRVGGHGPAVVMLHGFGTTGDMWGRLASQPRKCCVYNEKAPRRARRRA